ncbi:ABC transporter ATP-binding protein [Actinomadura sp. LOL_016]|uniref:ABC transporter ATP-binding protein n=1 Tax=unclassified Actinomadura TaxID=2626254 RepID=UPI003A7FAF60
MIDRLARYLGPEKAHLIRGFLWWTVIAGVLQGVALGLMIPVLRALLLGDLAAAAWWLLALAGAAVVYWLVDYRAVRRGFDVALELLTGLRYRMGDHIATLPLGWFVPANTSRLGHALSKGVMDMLGLPTSQLTPLVRAIVTPATLLVVLTVVDWRLGGVAAVSIVLLTGVYWFAGRLGRRSDEAVNAAMAETSDRIVEFAHTQPVLRTLDRDGAGQAIIDCAIGDQARRERRNLWLVVPPLLANNIVMQLALLGLIAGLLTLAAGTTGPLELATLLATLPVVNRFVAPLGDVAGHAIAIRMSRAEMDTIDDILTAEALPEPVHSGRPEGTDIVVDDLVFGYRPERPVIDHADFTIPANSLTAIVGPSGAGKSTLVRLLARFYDPSSGSVRIGGTDLRDLDSATRLALVAPVFQDNYLFNGTIEDNVRLGRPDATAAQLDRAAELARLSEVVTTLPRGWATGVGEGGTRLSGGERQRVALARALLKEAPILLLDEATGSLDAENQHAVSVAITELGRERTIVVVAHQLTTITEADQILFLENGRITERGTHPELLAADGRYAKHWRLLAAAKAWQLTTAGTPADD